MVCLAIFILVLYVRPRYQDHWSSGSIFLWPLYSDIIFFIDHYCAGGGGGGGGVSNKHCLLPFFSFAHFKKAYLVNLVSL